MSDVRTAKVGDLLVRFCTIGAVAGLSYFEMQVLFMAGAELMAQIDKDPTVNDDQMAAQVERFILEQLTKGAPADA